MPSQTQRRRKAILDLKMILDERLLCGRKKTHNVIIQTKSELLRHDNYIREFVKHCEVSRIVGIDCKWVGNNKISLLQLAEPGGRSLLIRLCKVTLPSAISLLFSNSRVMKLGFKIRQMMVKLQQDYQLLMVSWVDIRHMIRQFRPQSRIVELTDVANCLIGEGQLGSQQQDSNWEEGVLNPAQSMYATNCAYVAVNSMLALTLSLIETGKLTSANNSYSYDDLIESCSTLCTKYIDAPYMVKQESRLLNGVSTRVFNRQPTI